MLPGEVVTSPAVRVGECYEYREEDLDDAVLQAIIKRCYNMWKVGRWVGGRKDLPWCVSAVQREVCRFD